MAGSPLKRARKQGVRLADGRIIAFPYMPRVGDLPPEWRHFSAAQKVEHLRFCDTFGQKGEDSLGAKSWFGLTIVKRT